MKIALQLSALLQQCKDPSAALRVAREAGFDRVEPCLALEAAPGQEHRLWPLDAFLQNLREAAALGLEAVSCHIRAPRIASHIPELLRVARETGIRRFVVKSPAECSPERLQEAAIDDMTAASALAEVGAELLVHNGRADIEAKIGGRTAWETLLDLCCGKVFGQADVGWALAGEEDPEALLWRNAARVRSVHFKDFAAGSPSEVPIGKGRVDTVACFQFARAFGCDLVVDMDSFPNAPAEDLAASCRVLRGLAGHRERTASYLNILDTETGAVRVVRRFEGVMEAPNWLQGEEKVLYNADGHIYTCDLETGETALVDTGFCDSCNNDHVVSADGKSLAVSHMTFDQGFTSRVYVLPLAGGEPRLVTPNTPSFLHGWSPDGKEMAYCAFRDHGAGREVDVYTIPAEGGEEQRLTRGGFNDGPEYSPDGRYIWYNSTRSGLMQLWRMRRDGSEQTQMTAFPRNNWFGHVSPDGKNVVWISYAEGELDPDEHLPNMRVELWRMAADGSEQKRLVSFFGGQGSMNVNSWAADSRRVAFVSYELEHR